MQPEVGWLFSLDQRDGKYKYTTSNNSGKIKDNDDQSKRCRYVYRCTGRFVNNAGHLVGVVTDGQPATTQPTNSTTAHMLEYTTSRAGRPRARPRQLGVAYLPSSWTTETARGRVIHVSCHDMTEYNHRRALRLCACGNWYTYTLLAIAVFYLCCIQ